MTNHLIGSVHDLNGADLNINIHNNLVEITSDSSMMVVALYTPHHSRALAAMLHAAADAVERQKRDV